MIKETTERGFQLIRFKDRYNKNCSIQQSSAADFEPPGTSALWLGIDSKRMHLNREQVEWLAQILQTWLIHGYIFKLGE
jgi:hypothetical protein